MGHSDIWAYIVRHLQHFKTTISTAAGATEKETKIEFYFIRDYDDRTPARNNNK